MEHVAATPPRKRLIVNADDFGLDPAVNAAIIQAHTTGILTSTSLLVTAPSADEAVALARRQPRLGVGIHLCLVQGRSALNNEPFTDSVLRLARAVEAELRAQIERFLATGLQPTHLDAHMHTLMHPRVLPVVIRLARDYRINWVRPPREELWASLRSGGTRWLRWPVFAALGGRARRKLRAAGIHTADRAVGVLNPGQLTEEFVVNYLRRLPDGVTEMFFHPATESNAALRACQPAYQHAGELQALCSPRARAVVEAAGIQLVSYRDLVG